MHGNAVIHFDGIVKRPLPIHEQVRIIVLAHRLEQYAQVAESTLAPGIFMVIGGQNVLQVPGLPDKDYPDTESTYITKSE